MPFLAGAIYFGAVFAVGFLLGALRIAWVAPVVGPVWAVALELPFMLAASWWASGRVMARVRIVSAKAAMTMGVAAFAMLIVAETGLAVFLGRAGLASVVASYGTPEGGLGLSGQIIFGLFPVLRARLASPQKAEGPEEHSGPS